ncbi:MAG: hypothetical protein ACTSQB_04460 [Candidatus Heimdallarchaeota archaeon]
MNDDCKGKTKSPCGEFKDNTPKDDKLKHLTDCKQGLLKKVEEIDKAIAKLEE